MVSMGHSKGEIKMWSSDGRSVNAWENMRLGFLTKRVFAEWDVEQYLILSGDHLYRMNYADFIRHHRATKAGITLGGVPVDARRASDFGLVEFITIKSLVATGSAVPGSCAGHSRVPSPDRGPPASTGGAGLSQCDNA